MATILNRIYNPITGVFGSGNVTIYAGRTALTGAQTATTYTWTVPPGVDAVRVRLWGGGGNSLGAGGGFAMKTIYGLSGTTSVLVSVGFGGNATTTTGGTSSFGSFVSATGGAGGGTGAGAGAGSGGDINTSGGTSVSPNGAGAGSIFGNGASAGASNVQRTTYGGGGVGGTNANGGGSGFIGVGAAGNSVTTVPLNVTAYFPAGSGLNKFSIDFIGTGGGGTSYTNGRNGGGSSDNAGITVSGGVPGGGAGASGLGGYGLVIVEW